MTAHGHYIVPLVDRSATEKGSACVGVMFLYTEPNPAATHERVAALHEIGELITTAILQGTFASPYIRLLHSSRAKFTFGEPVKWTRDGEAGGAHRTVTLENQHSAYSILL